METVYVNARMAGPSHNATGARIYQPAVSTGKSESLLCDLEGTVLVHRLVLPCSASGTSGSFCVTEQPPRLADGWALREGAFLSH